MAEFLSKVKVKRFAEVKKKYGLPPYNQKNGKPFSSYNKWHYRLLERIENKQPDDVFTVVGQTTVKEGVSDWLGSDEGFTFDETKTYKVFIVANGLHKRFKVLPEDLEVVLNG